MSFAESDRLLFGEKRELLSPADLALCLDEIAKAWGELDQRMDRIHDLLPPDIRKAIDTSPFLDTFMAYRTMLVHAAKMHGVATAHDPEAHCPYSVLQRSEREAWFAARYAHEAQDAA